MHAPKWTQYEDGLTGRIRFGTSWLGRPVIEVEVAWSSFRYPGETRKLKPRWRKIRKQDYGQMIRAGVYAADRAGQGGEQ